MKKLLGFIICMTLIPALLLALGAGFVYDNYFKPVPMEYEFLRGEKEICSVEYAIISFESDGAMLAERRGFIEDMPSFISELKSVECYSGISLESIEALYTTEQFPGFVINYNDGSFEVITPYICLNSDIRIEGVDELLHSDIYSFDRRKIIDMLAKYSPVGGTKT